MLEFFYGSRYNSILPGEYKLNSLDIFIGRKYIFSSPEPKAHR